MSDSPASPANATVVVDDPDVRITVWTFTAPGQTTGLHSHEYDYVVVPITGGTLLVTSGEQTTPLIQDAGSPYNGSAGTEHTVASTTNDPVRFVEVEVKL